MRYPIEIELTDFCWLACRDCINPHLENKSYMSISDFKKILEYIYVNKKNILYVNLSWIGDVFLHPDFTHLIDLFCNKFRWEKVNVLIPNKWQAYTQVIIESLQKIKDAWLWLNVSVWFFSLLEDKHNRITQRNTFYKTMNFMKSLKKYSIPFSIELATNDVREEKYLKKIWNLFNVWYSMQWMHNFWWFFKEQQSPEAYQQCSFDVSNDYILEDFYCPFIPLISKEWQIYTCSISWKKAPFFYKDFNYFFKNK